MAATQYSVELDPTFPPASSGVQRTGQHRRSGILFTHGGPVIVDAAQMTDAIRNDPFLTVTPLS